MQHTPLRLRPHVTRQHPHPLPLTALPNFIPPLPTLLPGAAACAAAAAATALQAGTQFCDSQFSREVATGTLKASSLERFSCVALAGVVTEYLRFGQSEGGLGDIMQLDRLFAALGFSQKKADGEVRWAVLNCAALLRDHAAVHDRLAEAMAAGLPVGGCIELIETELAAGAAAAGEDKAVHSRTPVT